MKKKKLLLVLILAILFLRGVWIVKDRQSEEDQVIEQEVGQESAINQPENQITLVINFGQDQVETYPLDFCPPCPEGAQCEPCGSPTVYGILVRAAAENGFDLKTKDSDLGILIEEIASVKNTQDQFWLFYVNGEMAQVSADKFELKSNDMVEWKYEEF